MSSTGNRWGTRLCSLWPRAWLGLLAAALLAGCGFQLRGTATLPYDTIYIDLPPNNALAAELKRNLRAGTTTRVVEKREDAQAILQANSESRSKIILSLNSAGAVREFRLKYGFAYRVISQKGEELAAPGDLVLERDFTFNDSQVLAKESEEALIFRDMQTDMVQQVMRRIAATAKAPAR